MTVEEIKEKLYARGLKVTPQRIATYQALLELDGHPTAEDVKNYLAKNYPSITLGTIYNTLNTFVNNGLIKRIKSGSESTQYDVVLESHHHLYDTVSGRISDYYDEGIKDLLEEYFREHEIPGFEIEDIQIDIFGKPASQRTEENEE
ncbi:MAG: transcriptional repressor [Bacteroidales bacterium]|nr:transcriptional repressor [Bacteroidales bacterium]